MVESSAQKEHQWKFLKSGSLIQVCLENGDDIANIDKLDSKLWSAMMCPVDNMEFDSKTLEYLDTDNDKRIKLPEIVAGVKWVCSVLKDPNVLLKPKDKLPLSEINDSCEEGAQILVAVKQILRNLDLEKNDSIGLEELGRKQDIFAATAFNGDGIIPSDAAKDPNTGFDSVTAADVEKFIADAVNCMGGEADRSGKLGISQPLLESFLKECSDYDDWIKASEKPGVMFAGSDSEEIYKIYAGLKNKIDDYFTRCALVSFDRRYEAAGQELNLQYASLLKKNLNRVDSDLKEMPLALASSDGVLPLYGRTNPAWSADLVLFSEKVAENLVGRVKELTEPQWNTIKGRIKLYEDWVNSKKGKSVEKLGIERIEEILKSGLQTKVISLIEHDRSLSKEFDRIASIDKLIRYYKYIYTLLNNFVCFGDLYDPDKKAVFQAGTLYMDGRSCELCVKVSDIAVHSSAAQKSNIFLAYCLCTKQNTGEKINICAAFTDGDSDSLSVGRNGIFVDRKGQHWDATIKKIVDHPISIRQAFWSPYKKLGQMVNQQIEKFAASKEAAVTAGLSKSVDAAAKGVQQGTKPSSASFDVAKFAGIFAAVGLALGTIGTAFSAVFSQLKGLTWYQIILVVIGVLAVISGPSMLLTALRLKKRSLGSILNANGWAVNTQAQISLSMGRRMTDIARLPKGSKVTIIHPYGADNGKKYRRLSYFIVVVVILAIAGWFSYIYCPSVKVWADNLLGCNKCASESIDGKTDAVSAAKPEVDCTFKETGGK